jgi:NAD(P)-dependent dehydrogenase (short-subunit alcohol dehydrogenase family)
VRLDGQVAVVTGGASGIGRSMCLAFAREGAAGVVVADVDGGGAEQVAEQVTALGGRAIAVNADMANEADVRALIAHVEAVFGRIDLLCSNAGVIVPGGVEVPDEAWSRVWAINVDGHVRAARAVLPGMLARGRGYLLFTASAAGLLTQLGSAPYSVTKHALVALAEWLSITYGDRGIRVSCLCPQAVRTNLGATSAVQMGAVQMGAVRPGEPGAVPSAREGAVPSAQGAGSVSAQASVDGVLTADDVAECVIRGLASEHFLILPHPEVATYERRRADDRDRWLRGMRRLQARLSGGDLPGSSTFPG